MVVVRLYPLGIRKSNGIYFVTPSGLEFSLAHKPERKLGATHIQALRACWRRESSMVSLQAGQLSAPNETVPLGTVYG